MKRKKNCVSCGNCRKFADAESFGERKLRRKSSEQIAKKAYKVGQQSETELVVQRHSDLSL